MVGETVIYCGRVIAKEGFRAFVYGIDNKQKLVESWKEFESVISSGIWFATKELAALKDKPKKKGG